MDTGTIKAILAVAVILYILRNIFIAPILNRLDYLTDLLESGKIVIGFEEGEEK